jgi:phospholipase/carboxylesterase
VKKITNYYLTGDSMQLRYELIQPKQQAQASVIWLHGLGASGHDFVSVPPMLRNLSQYPVRYIFPHAPEQPVTINGGLQMPAWYDIRSMEFTSEQDELGICASQEKLEELISNELKIGIPENKILLVGFSQGGAIVLHSAFRRQAQLAGVASLSSYLPIHYKFAEQMCAAAKNTPVFMAHGENDVVVPIELGLISKKLLQQNGCEVTWSTYPMDHSVCQEELNAFDNWAVDKLFNI